MAFSSFNVYVFVCVWVFFKSPLKLGFFLSWLNLVGNQNIQQTYKSKDNSLLIH